MRPLISTGKWITTPHAVGETLQVISLVGEAVFAVDALGVIYGLDYSSCRVEITLQSTGVELPRNW